MTLSDTINTDLKEAMKAKDQAGLRAIRAIKSAILLLKTQGTGDEISEKDEIQLLQRLVKQRKESIEVYKKQNREDLVQEESDELEVITKYLPKQISLKEIEDIVKVIISETGASSMADLKKVMPLAMGKLAGRADGKTISEVVKKLLSA
ncbi:MAG: GatB/YqeY domain-containing protein [Bacteroidetes bacterium]|jgi:hypothetical protein|nr:GatB/YqeY domain-containing protein [Bacteroidota bacterium]MBT5527887.1 GatB/YqeY domain-containing protein [Cytophagia bacterium]MBT3424904.1 GatB/YqeY domain-containing protein [Bacteroidota bacterium]MBT3801962.1 GatB/YqeY domain-containing protein [Bacteroidota bacterium]MBT3933942.1 GatB/YqeY domain-containing protein [Bacteroidota bacterium]